MTPLEVPTDPCSPNDLKFMSYAFALAAKGYSTVSPNPAVGCVIVNDGKIIGEGYHERAGQAHAEVIAINKVLDRRSLIDSILYVTLEPCNHHGKTHPCSDLILASGIREVVYSAKDSNITASGGASYLEGKGIRVRRVLTEFGENATSAWRGSLKGLLTTSYFSLCSLNGLFLPFSLSAKALKENEKSAPVTKDSELGRDISKFKRLLARRYQRLNFEYEADSLRNNCYHIGSEFTGVGSMDQNSLWHILRIPVFSDPGKNWKMSSGLPEVIRIDARRLGSSITELYKVVA